MIVYRIGKKEYINDLAGVGAGLFGGRWNPKGINLVYTAGSLSLAMLEFFVHNYHILSTSTICLARIEIRNTDRLQHYPISALPDGWNSPKGHSRLCRQIGKDFVKSGLDYLLKVPYVIVQGEYNILLNPAHSDHLHTKIIEIIDPFEFDGRLLELVKG
jgi:RES domain-containing protein